MFSVATDRLSTFTTSLTSLLGSELMSVSPQVRDLSASTRYLSLLLRIHRGKASWFFT
jgi:hypothetical protein